MARSDLIKRLFRSHISRDDHEFKQAALEIIDEARKKRHYVLAKDLVRTLEEGSHPLGTSTARQFQPLNPLPKDSDTGHRLVDFQWPERGLDELALFRSQQDVLSDVLEQVRDWAVLEANGLSPSSKLLFFGPPGCGKSVTAAAISQALQWPLAHVRFDSLISSLLGETATNLRKVFDFAEEENCVLFFDEFDALGRARDSNVDHAELKRVVNTFLQLLDAFKARSVVIAATNHEHILDKAIWRRFDEVIQFPLPNSRQIAELLRIQLNGWGADWLSVLDLQQLAGMSYAAVERICVNSKKRSVLQGKREVSERLFLAELVKQQQRLALEAESKPESSEESCG